MALSLEAEADAEQVPLRMPTRRRSKALVIGVAILGLVAVVLALAGTKFFQFSKMMKVPQTLPPESVTATKATAASWREARAATGTLVAVRGVTLGAEISGTVQQINFDSGALVKKGAIMVRLNTSTEQAQLQSAQAEATLAKVNLGRVRALRQTGANTPADLDQAEARTKQSEAAVDSLLSTIAKKTIRAPFDGRVAIRQVELGQVLSPGTPIASLHQVSPMYVEFSLPQQAIADLKVGDQIEMTIDIFPGSKWQGKISVINPEVEVTTRNVRTRATIDNPDGRLAPGMFASVEAFSGHDQAVTIVPATSVIYAPYGDSVFVLEGKKDDAQGKNGLTARQRFVRLGARRGDFVAVTSGLTAGETIVSSGAFKLRNGSQVVVNNALAPEAELSPKPADN